MNITDRTELVLRSLIVTIDGPAGSGKSTTASLLAERLEFSYLDTGAMYRAVTYAVLGRGVDPDDAERVSEVATGVDLDLRIGDGPPAWFLDGQNIEREIRTPEVSDAVSPVSRHEGVRSAMVRLQRRIGARGGVVAEGRDTGSAVFPHAHVKVFLAADVATRARRRQAQLHTMGIDQGLAEIEKNIVERDRIDSSREVSPLVRPPGSMLIDTSSITIDEQVGLVEAAARREAERIAGLVMDEGDPYARMRRYYAASHAGVRGVFELLFGLRIFGRENLCYRENFIFASNHVSYADPLAVGGSLDREVYFLAKKELFQNALFGRLIRAYHAIPVDRDEIELKTMKLVLELLARGDSILMFPEGTRSRNGEIAPLKAGLGFTAINSGVSVIPVCVTGSNHLGDCFLRRRKLEVRIGAPIRVPKGSVTDDRKRDYQVLTDMVRSALRMLKDEASA